MNCSDGCVSINRCDGDITFLVTSILLGFIAFCGGQFCYIVSLRKRLQEDYPSLINEVPPPYNSTEENI